VTRIINKKDGLVEANAWVGGEGEKEGRSWSHVMEADEIIG